MKLFPLFLITLLYIPLSHVSAAEVEGQTIVAGKQVNLYSNNTWKYKDASKVSDNPCVTLSKQIDFCDKLGEWENLNSTSPNHLVLYGLGEKDWGMIIDEGLGAEDGMSFETMRYATIKRAANGSGVSFDEIKVISDENIEFAGMAGLKMVYKVEYKGAPFIFSNTMLFTQTMNFQFVTYSYTKTFTPSISETHEKFLNLITIN
jgi:hypothetical protein